MNTYFGKKTQIDLSVGGFSEDHSVAGIGTSTSILPNSCVDCPIPVDMLNPQGRVIFAADYTISHVAVNATSREEVDDVQNQSCKGCALGVLNTGSEVRYKGCNIRKTD